jgi:hypothetical protein
MSKQTAVEWLWRWINDNQEATIEQGNEAFEQAKAMEKEQIIDAYKYGNQSDMYFKPEQYYTETFKPE